MSSRNVRLNPQERVLAANIPKWMKEANSLVKDNMISEAKQFIQHRVAAFPEMKLDYYEVCDADTLHLITDTSQASKHIALIALFVGEVRLIDNLMVS
jgi:pantoate--beta-alanine ligase